MVTLNKSLFSSAKTDWETPQYFFDLLNAEFGFEIDVCATAENAKCEVYYTPEDDALTKEWQGICWMNPPYGRYITPKWVKKAYESSLKGATVVCLLPARTDTKWWHDYCMKSHDIRFVQGRLKFVGAEYGAPFPSAVVVFRPPTSRYSSLVV